MDLATIEMPVQEARKKFLEYREAVKGRHYAEDEEIMAGYRQLARGKRLLRMSETLAQGGFDGRGLPKLGLAMADVDKASNVFVRVAYENSRQRTVTFSPRFWARTPNNAGRQSGVTRFVLPCPEETPRVATTWNDWQAIVPLVPPALRPKSLAPYFVLFEATWFQTRAWIKGDPALVKHLGGDLWVVVATWDLTPLERAVLSQ